VREILDSLDDDGRWLQKYAGERLLESARFEEGEPYLSSAVFSQNLTLLSRYLQTPPDRSDSTDKPPVLVYVLAGQSNMGGVAKVEDLELLVDDPDHAETFGRLKATDGDWVSRDDVWIVNVADYLQNRGPLTVGFGEKEGQFGPELEFGNVVGDARDDPVLIIKVTQGPMSLADEGRPPGSGGAVGPYYWRLVSVVDAVLQDVGSLSPALRGRRAQLAGFVWFQGWNDWLMTDRIQEYDENLAHLIRDLRAAWDVPNLPVVIGEFGQHGPLDANGRLSEPQQRAVQLRSKQQAVAGLPEFQGNVALVETTSFVRDGPGGMFLYSKNAETFYQIGEAFGHAMLELEEKPRQGVSSPDDVTQGEK